MLTERFRLAAVAAAIMALGWGGLASASAEEMSSIARGGKLYDKWYAVTNAAKPTANHPAWPAAATGQKGDTTWRCKSCHGWDGMGKDGAYATGSYNTGIKGIKGMAGAEPARVIAVLKNDLHKLADKMSDADFQDLALFVSKGQVDMDRYIDRASKAPKGDKAKGEAYFLTLCAGCHGTEGKLPKEMPPLGSLMGNPWEIMHKIQYGQPAEAMPALLAIDRQITVDLMAYLTTLPAK
jgi:thiosulfate dehydrogenase